MTRSGHARPSAPSGAGPVHPRTATLHVSVVCTGNICRSPIAEQLVRAAVTEAGLADRVRISSAGTGDWHVGQGANPQAVAALARAGHPSEHRAHQITAEELAGIDLVLAADRGHVRVLRRMTDRPDKIRLLRTFDPQAEHDEIPDPYLGPDSGFDDVVAMTTAAIPGILDEIRARLR